MPKTVQLGPILGFEGETSRGNSAEDLTATYTVLILHEDSGSGPPVLDFTSGSPTPFEAAGRTHNYICWRAELSVDLREAGHRLTYRIHSVAGGELLEDREGDAEWSFYVRGRDEQPRLAFASCNGFSEAAMSKRCHAYRMWEVMGEENLEKPYALLLMGGDQLYADSMWGDKRMSELQKWIGKPLEERIKAKATVTLHKQLAKFYEDLYIERWSPRPMAQMLARIPSVMTWDDHDIFDGWGSYVDSVQDCDVYRAIFAAARQHYALLQLRGAANKALFPGEHRAPDCDPERPPCDSPSYAWRLAIGSFQILGLDTRSQRRTDQVMCASQWQTVKNWLEESVTADHDLLVISPVPVLYRSFERTEANVYGDTDLSRVPSDDSLSDDLRDHWRSAHHQGERLKLIHNLLRSRARRRIILSGDVHTASCGRVEDRRHGELRLTYQVTSSPLVHTPPIWWQWLGMLAVSNDRDEVLEPGIEARMLKPNGGPQYLRERNFVSLHIDGSTPKVWVHWHCEDQSHAPNLTIPCDPASESSMPS